MAKTNTIVVKLLSTADTGFFYVAKKNPRTQTEKLEFGNTTRWCASMWRSGKQR